MFPIILVFILRESVDQSNNPTSRLNMNSRNVVCIVAATYLFQPISSSFPYLPMVKNTPPKSYTL